MDALSPEFQAKVQQEALAIRGDLVLEMVAPDHRTVSKMPLIWVNVQDRVDVATLWKTHETFGEGDQAVRWLYLFNLERVEETVFYLDIAVQIPRHSRINYFVAFPVIDQEELIESLVQVLNFSIMTDQEMKLKKLIEGRPRTSLGREHFALLRQGLQYENLGDSDRKELQSMLNRWRGLMGRKKR